ncbi:DUF6456 domain-containing protein [Gemmobacter megaterium]|nr:DUF6456 domain-containing protein [Gemmobacter megaterium]
MTGNLTTDVQVPGWLPDMVRNYLDHAREGLSLREIARREGLHASTVLRQVRRIENRRDDPLVDAALDHLVRSSDAQPGPQPKETPSMTAPIRTDAMLTDAATLAREGRRILRRLSEPGAMLAIAPDMEKAAVLREFPDGRSARTAVVDRAVAQAFALKDWIACRRPGRVASYEITPAGRAALKRFLEEEAAHGMAEAPQIFAAQHRVWGERTVDDDGEPRRIRYNMAESPAVALGRRRDKDGVPFLSAEQVAAAERLREDFELAQMGPRVAQNWDRFLTAGTRGDFGPGRGPAEGPRGARERVAAALRDLGPGLGDMVLRCCCYLEGLETAEKRLGWSARSGKVVLRIALDRLRRHYQETYGGSTPLIG